MRTSLPLLADSDFPAIRRHALNTVQVNLGYLCNQSCLHCHVNAGPTRKEIMTGQTADVVVEFMHSRAVSTVDFTGGAPEMNPEFRRLVEEASALGLDIIDRCNLTILNMPGYEDLAEFLALHRVRVVASLPCYTEELVDQQRGNGVYEDSISALRKLNQLGYGVADNGLTLDLVYNPQGPTLPPPQEDLELEYKRQLDNRFGVKFSNLLTLANLPVGRFGSVLQSKGQFTGYVQLLKDSFRPENLRGLMCRSLISIDWQGYVYDCDFNQMLDLPVVREQQHLHLRDVLDQNLMGHSIRVADHCYGCTAGQGSSCGGALEADDAKTELVS